MLYFAYGSNINLDHLTDYLDTHGVSLDTDLQAKHALLHNYRLRTNYFANSHGAGACNIEPAHDHRVEGVLMSITPAVREALRVKEGSACSPKIAAGSSSLIGPLKVAKSNWNRSSLLSRREMSIAKSDASQI